MVTNFKKWEYSLNYYNNNLKINRINLNEQNYGESLYFLNRYAMNCYAIIENTHTNQLPKEYRTPLAYARVKSQYGLKFLSVGNDLGRDLNDIEITHTLNTLNDIITHSLKVVEYINLHKIHNANDEKTDYKTFEKEDKAELENMSLELDFNF